MDLRTPWTLFTMNCGAINQQFLQGEWESLMPLMLALSKAVGQLDQFTRRETSRIKTSTPF